ncbi:hypothetical protein D3C87_1884000 [compost metagenome]
MLFGSISEAELPKSKPPLPLFADAEFKLSLLIATPSTTINAWLFPVKLFDPRSTMLVDPPKLELVLTSKPATLPDKLFRKLFVGVELTVFSSSFCDE